MVSRRFLVSVGRILLIAGSLGLGASSSNGSVGPKPIPLADICHSYLLSPAGSRQVNIELPSGQAIALLKAAAAQYRQREGRILELQRAQPALKTTLSTAWGNLGWTSWITGGHLGSATAHATYRTAKAASAANQTELESLQRQTGPLPKELELQKLISETATSVLRQALLDPPPKWATHLQIAKVTLLAPANLVTDGDIIQVEVQFQGSPTARVRKKYLKEISVFLELSVKGSRAGIIYSQARQEEDIHAYDDFRLGTVLDPQTNQRARHSAVDYRLKQLGILAIPEQSLALTSERMSEDATIRRQVHQVLYAAVNIAEKYGQLPNSSTQKLIDAYFEYWATAPALSKDNMLKSAFLIKGLSVGSEDQEDIVDSIKYEIRQATAKSRAFTREGVRDRLQSVRAAISQGVASSSTSSDDGFFWMWYWSSTYGPHPTNPNYIGPELPIYGDLIEATGKPEFDSPAFGAYESISNPGATDLPADAAGFDSGTDGAGGGADSGTGGADSGGGGDGGGDGGS